MVDFQLSEEQQMIRDTIGAFARDEIRPAARLADESAKIPPELTEKIWQLGLVRGTIPETYGGDGGERSAVTGALVAEELGYGDLSIGLHALAPRLFAYPIMEMGTAEQKAAYLKRFTAPTFVPATAALMEPRWDFDLTDLATAARREGPDFVLNGRKCVVPLAAEAEAILVYAKNGSASGFEGVDAFVVAHSNPGLKINDREQNIGLKDLATHEIALEQCRV